MNTTRRAALVAALLAATALLTAPAFAEDAAPATATFVVRVIEASKGDTPSVDPRIEEMRRELRPFESRYNRFALVREATFTLQPQGSQEVALPANSKFALQFVGLQPGKVPRVRYQATTPGGRTMRSVAPGARTLDAIGNGDKLTIVSTLVR